MFGRYTERAQQALKAAGRIAGEMGQRYIGTEHLLLSLLEGSESSLPQLESLTPEKVRSAVAPSSAAEAFSPAFNFTPRMKQLLAQAHAESQRLGHKFVTVEHLWLAMFADGECKAYAVMKKYGVDVEAARKQLDDEMRQAEKAPAQEEPQSERPQPPQGPAIIAAFRVAPQMNTQQSIGNQSGGGSAIKQFTRDMTEMARNNALDPVIGREEEIQRVIQILIRRTKNNPVLIGEPGVGKTAVVEGLAQQIVAGNVPEMLLGKRVLMLDMSAVVAGTRYRGDFEERMKRCIEEIRKSGNTVLFIDELHNIVGAGNPEGEMDAANLLKPALARGALQCIGATTTDEYRKHIEKDRALERRFQPVTVNEPSVAATEQMLFGLRDKYEAHHKVQITDEALSAAVRLSSRYLTDRFLPDKAIDLIDEAASRVRIRAATTPSAVKQLEEALERTLVEKREAISSQNFEKAAQMRDEEQRIRDQITQERERWTDRRSSERSVVTDRDVALVVSEWTGIPVTQMTETETERLMHLEETLHARVVGQDEAVRAVAHAIRRGRTGLKDPKRPIGSFLLLGPTGVGKTELCRAVGEAVFGDENAVIRLDMSEYMEKFNVARLIGAPPGYVGYEEGGQLTEAVRRKPYSVVLLDEIEKAHPDVFNILLQVLEDGRLTDSQGRVVSFRNTIIIMTSNAGAHEIERVKSLGFGAQDAKTDIRAYERMREAVMKAVKDSFRPEFINRLDETIVFHALSEENIVAIADLMLGQVASLMRERGAELTWTPEVAAALAREGYDPKYGARPLRRLIQRKVEDLLSEELLAGRLTLRDHVTLVLRDGEIAAERVEAQAESAPLTKEFAGETGIQFTED